MTGEDLTTQAGLAVQQDLALVNLLGITHVERNGHHYVNGMADLPRARTGCVSRGAPGSLRALPRRGAAADSRRSSSRSGRSAAQASRAARSPTGACSPRWPNRNEERRMKWFSDNWHQSHQLHRLGSRACARLVPRRARLRGDLEGAARPEADRENHRRPRRGAPDRVRARAGPLDRADRVQGAGGEAGGSTRGRATPGSRTSRSTSTTSTRCWRRCGRTASKPISPPVAIDQGPNKGRRVVYTRDPDGITIEFIEGSRGAEANP